MIELRTRFGSLVAVTVICGGVLTAPALAQDSADSAATGPAVIPEMGTIDVAGQEVDTTLWRAPTAADVFVVSPSLNSNVNDLAVVAATIAGQDCANVVAFDSSQASALAPVYLAIIDGFEGFGFDPGAPFSTLGSSATAARALVAAQQRGGQAVFVFSPSDPPPLTAAEVDTYVGLYITTGDVQYRPLFDEWTAAGFDGHVVEGENHGTRFLTEAAAQPITDELIDHICGHPEGFHDPAFVLQEPEDPATVDSEPQTAPPPAVAPEPTADTPAVAADTSDLEGTGTAPAAVDAPGLADSAASTGVSGAGAAIVPWLIIVVGGATSLFGAYLFVGGAKSDRSLEQINAEIGEVDQQLADLTSEGYSQQVEQFGGDLEEVQAFLDSNLEDLEEVKGKIEEYVGDLKDMTKEMRALLERDGIKKFIDGVSGGIESTANVVGKVNDGLGKLDKALSALKIGGRLTSDDAKEQLEAFADAFELVTDKLGSYIQTVPGLGAFFQIYGMSIRNIAESTGVLIEITDRNNELYQKFRPGQHLFITAETIKSDKIRDLEFKRVQLMDEAMQAATDERLTREEGELGSGVTEVDIVVRTALRHSTDARPAINSDAYSSWVKASKKFQVAQGGRESALVNLALVAQDAKEASVHLKTAPGPGSDTAALEAKTEMTAAALKRAQTRMDEANTSFDQAVESYTEANAAHRAEIEVYDNAVRTEIIKLIPLANIGKGFTDSDYAELALEYPLWSVSP